MHFTRQWKADSFHLQCLFSFSHPRLLHLPRVHINLGQCSAALHAQINQACTLKVIDCSFTGCSASRGGAIYLHVKAKPSSMLFDGLTFAGQGNTATSNQKYGHTIYVDIDKTNRHYLQEGNFPAFITGDSTTDNEARTYYTVNKQDPFMPLTEVWEWLNGILAVSKDQR